MLGSRRSQEFDWRWYAAGALALYLFWRERGGAAKTIGWRGKEVIADFKNKVETVARAVEAETGIRTSLGITQAALESGYGNSDLSRPTSTLPIYVGENVVRHGPALNIFGMKAGKAWIEGGHPYVRITTTDYPEPGKAVRSVSAFRAYSSWEESYRDWARLMQTAAYVADGALEALVKGNLKALGAALAKRYAPNQDYDKRLAARAREMGVA